MNHTRVTRTISLITLLLIPGSLVLAQSTGSDGGRGAAAYFSEDFADNSAGWTLDTEWEIGPAVSSPPPGACGNGDPATDTTPTADNGIAGVVIGGNASTSLHSFYYLTSPVVDASAAPGSLYLNFKRWLNSDYAPYMENVVEVFDGSSWQPVWSSGPPPNIEDASWIDCSYDITAYKNASLRVRIGFEIGSAGSYTCSSWNVDDLEIADAPIPVELMSFLIE
jgi:hypothetical protein